jgi:AraC-like DNA-binding protein
MEAVLSEIKQNYLDPEFNVNQIVEKMGMSRSLFYKKFKSLSDQSINDLIKNFRLKKAAKLLADGNLTVSQVAYECGFTDPAYFSRVFKEYYSVAPKDFDTHGQTV